MTAAAAAAPSAAARGVYRRLLGYMRPYRGRLTLGILMALVFGSGLIGAFLSLDRLLGAFEVDGPFPEDSYTVAWILPLLMVVSGFGQYLSVYFIHWVGYRVVTDLREEAFSHLQRLSLSFYSRARAGDLISRVSNDTIQVQQAVSNVVGDLIREPVKLVVALIVVIYKLIELDALGASFSLLVLPLAVVPVVLLGRHVRRYAKQNQERLAGLVGILQENFSGVRVVKAFGMENYEVGKFRAENEHVFSRLLKLVLASRLNQPLMEVVAAISIVFALLYAKQVGMSLADFMIIALALSYMYQPVKRLGRLHMTVEQSSAAATRVFELLDTPIDVADRPDAVELSGPVESVQFEQVDFAYTDQPVLNQVDFTVRSGECFALVGGTGAGKTTLVNLVPRFFDATGGAVLINGRDIREYTLASLRQQIAVVTQDTFLFHDSIARNIAYGQDDPDPERLRDVARRARALEFIEALPNGFDTVIGDRGATLSGGQRQRLAIARALYRDAPILILDEATSALDSETERLVQEALNEVMQGRTVFAIAHRLSTIRHADRILVLKAGQVVEQGTHDELLARGGDYRYLYELQIKSREE